MSDKKMSETDHGRSNFSRNEKNGWFFCKKDKKHNPEISRFKRESFV